MFELQFSSLGEFLSMGDYAFNVWSVYLLFAIFLGINIYYPLLRRKQIVRELKRRLVLNAQSTAGKQESTPVSESLSSPIGGKS